MDIVAPIFIFSLMAMIGTVLYLVFKQTRAQSLALIQAEIDAGNTLRFKESVGGVVGGIRYKGPFLVVAIFDDCLIIKDKKVLFSDIQSVTQSTWSGIAIQTQDNQELKIYHNGSFLEFFPEALRAKST